MAVRPLVDRNGPEHTEWCTCEVCYFERAMRRRREQLREQHEERVIKARSRFLDHAIQCDRCGDGMGAEDPTIFCPAGQALAGAYEQERARRFLFREDDGRPRPQN